MSRRGTTLVELAVALSVAAALIASLGVLYQGWIRNYEVEKATKELYSDLMRLRVLAMEKNVEHYLVMRTDSYTLFEDKDDDGSPDEGEELPPYRKSLKYTLAWNNTGSTITCNKRGLITRGRSLWFVSDLHPDYDCVRLSSTRIIMGRHVIVREGGSDKDECSID